MDITDFLRYNRQMNLPEVGVEGQNKIKAAKILVIGAGGLGSPILTYLTSCGIGTLAIIDHDIIEQHNLHRQTLYTEAEIGESKTIIAQKKIKELNPHIHIISYNEKLTELNAIHLFNQYEIIVDGSDNFETRYLVNDTAVLLDKTVIYGSILGFKGQISVFNHKNSANLRDLFPTPPKKEDVQNCALNGVLGTFPGIIGTIMAHETLKVVLELPCLTNKLLLIDTLTWQTDLLTY
ncbi:HesA/MoeB/ThiF family protein [Myroides pelagicus]|uniref:Molybdopterin-synthase adenylyltransferase n=1 Tax=Myroides pelagicus TaxID=270914 RepID=A0A7K1GMT2_9FLAO|nr:HesA/MoeB/ThiF family protein [Myroides pelagicus]MEC4112608.1 HesA/MoeB/ThiF family protein [Myroides pelagicus]MTH29514.1 thiamine biosynthesis protein ThiF [Myroides pelagicus]